MLIVQLLTSTQPMAVHDGHHQYFLALLPIFLLICKLSTRYQTLKEPEVEQSNSVL
jgi:hypothetical protein